MPRADRIAAMKPYVFARLESKVERQLRSGRDVVDLGQADPDAPTPPTIVHALQVAVADPANHHYPPFRATAAFAEAVAAWYARRWGVQLDPATQVHALAGAKQGLLHLALACLTPGTVALVPDPAFPTYVDGAQFAGADVWRLPLRPEHGYLPVLDAVPPAVLQRARLLFLNYPHNPTGAVASRAFLSHAVDFCRSHDILLCYDNAYSEITFDGYQAPSILEFPGAMDVALEIITFSKAYNMAGFRLAMAAGSPEAIAALSLVESKANSGVFAAVQAAGIAALERVYGSPFPERLRQAYRGRRDRALRAAQTLGLPAEKPLGAAYLWLPLPPGFTDAEGFTDHVLEQAAVCLAPGSAFGDEGRQHFRISLTCPDDRLDLGLERLARLLAPAIR